MSRAPLSKLCAFLFVFCFFYMGLPRLPAAIYRLFIHPESQKFYADLIKQYGPATNDYEATATSSSRSLVVHPKNRPDFLFFVKISLGVELGGVDRTIPAAEVARSVGISKYI